MERNKVLIVMDDIIQEKRVRSSPFVSELFVLGRHLDISVVVLSQEIGGRGGLPLVVRNNAEVIQLFHTFNSYDKELVGQQFASLIDKKSGQDYIHNITRDKYTSAVIDNSNPQARGYDEYIYRYKVGDKIPKFSIGKKHTKKKNKERFLSEVMGLKPNPNHFNFKLTGREIESVNDKRSKPLNEGYRITL